MYFDYQWISDYLEKTPTLEEAAVILNQTGLETEICGNGLEIEHTVNRPDAMCHFGVARELSVKTGTQLIFPETDSAPLAELDDWTIQSENHSGCWHYMGLLVDNVENCVSPAWLQKKLETIEQTPHGLIVDLTNFLLWEMGHPSHAFDAEKIEDQTVRIRFAKPGEELTTLDGKEHNVEGLLCITDSKRPIALAGVMGGKDSEVDSSTRSLLFELAMFNPVLVRKSARKTQILSDAKHRFERGVDEEAMDRIVRRFIYLLKREQPQIRIRGLKNFCSKSFECPSVLLRKNRLDKLLGVSIPREEVLDLLTRMDFQPIAEGPDYQLKVPGYKVDVSREVDVIEEIIRFAGLDRLPSILPAISGSDYQPAPQDTHRKNIRTMLKESGFQEILTYSFLSGKNESFFQQNGSPIEIRNPLSESSRVLRRNILPLMLQTAGRNFARGQKDLHFFEMGHVYRENEEIYSLACLVSHPNEKASWHESSRVHPFYEIKGTVERLMEELGLDNLKWAESELKGMDPNVCLSLELNGEAIGWAGILAPELLDSLNLDLPVAVLELELKFLADHHIQASNQFTLSPFPSIQIDLAFVMDRDVPFEKVKNHISAQNLSFLEHLSLFDVYSGKSLEKGKKSMGFRFVFRAPDRTLTSDEVNQTIQTMTDRVMKEFNATIRS
jgi:phenylalanyl-tRNA synthetase beta chain